MTALSTHTKNNLATFLGIMFAVITAFIVAVITIVIFSDDPLKTMGFYFLGPFSNKFLFFNMIESTIPLIFTGLGMCIAFKSGVINLGGEGQIFAGAMMAVMLGVWFPHLPPVLGILLLFCLSI